MLVQEADSWLSVSRRKRLTWVLWWTLLAADLLVGVVRLATSKPAPLVVPFALVLAGVAALVRSGRLNWAAHGLSVLVACTVVAMTYLAGELVPILHCLAVIPLFATFIAGTRAGLIWCGLVLLILGLTAWGVATLPLPPPSGRALPGVSVAVVVCMVFTVTFAFEQARKHAIKSLQQKKNDSRTLLRLLPDDVIRVNDEGEVLQRSPKDNATPVDELFRTSPVRDAIRQALASDREQEVVKHLLGRVLNVRLIPVGKRELLALVRDRSDAKKLEERVTKAELIASLERSNRMSSIGVLAACIAHEVNNPLAYLAGNLTFLDERAKRNAAVDEEHIGALTDAMNATERVRSIVAELKHYSREEKEISQSLEPSKVVEEALKIVRNETRHIAKVSTEFETAQVRVAASPNRLVQVIVNLLLNAAQALPPARKATNTIEVRTTIEGDEVHIAVIDNGPGIPPELLERVTQPFFTTKAPGVGTGLGLAVCEEIVRQFSGTLSIENNALGGATITVRLPVAEDELASSSELECVDPPSTAPGRILIVDDEPLVRRALMRLLREHEVVEAEGGEEALELLKKDENFDLILCDVMMPVVSGLDMYARVRDEFAPLDERIVFMTGGAFDPRLQALMQATAKVPVIDKPFDPDHLRRTVGEVIRNRQAAPAASEAEGAP
ncbi:MAG: ATP-binding protein [Polyangiales bacterium]